MLLGADTLGRSVFGELPELEDEDANVPAGGGSHGQRHQVPPGFYTRKVVKPVHATAFGAIVAAGTSVRAGVASGTAHVNRDGSPAVIVSAKPNTVELVQADVVATVDATTNKTDISCFVQLLEGKASVDYTQRNAQDDAFVLEFVV